MDKCLDIPFFTLLARLTWIDAVVLVVFTHAVVPSPARLTLALVTLAHTMVGAATQLAIEACAEEVGALTEWTFNDLWAKRHTKGSPHKSNVKIIMFVHLPNPSKATKPVLISSDVT